MGDVGLFGPSSATWRVSREGVLLLGGGRALILQVAHPLVAAGVGDHSSYREEPWRRLYQTLALMTQIVFGDGESAERAVRRVRAVHSRVRGTTAEASSGYAHGTPYDARDPALLMWVHATLVDTSLLVYERCVGRLPIGERERYYEEQKLLAEKLGVPRAAQPDSYADFNEYVDAMLDGEALAVTDVLRDVVDVALRPPLPRPARPLAEALNLVTIGLLPSRLREELGLGWGPGRDRLLSASSGALRRLLPLLPSAVRELPPARRAERFARAASL